MHGADQGRFAAAVGLIGIGLVREQQSRTFDEAPLNRQHERRATVVVRQVHPGAAGEQIIGHHLIPLAHDDQQCGLAIRAVLGVHRRDAGRFKKLGNFRVVAFAHGFKKTIAV